MFDLIVRVVIIKKIFMFQAIENNPITIYGSGEQTRSFQYVSDLVSGLVLLMKSEYQNPVNIGNPQERSINTFATLIRDTGIDQSLLNIQTNNDQSDRY